MYLNTIELRGNSREIAVSRTNIFLEGVRVLESYDSKIAFYKVESGTIFINKEFYKYSNTTSRHLNHWLSRYDLATSKRILVSHDEFYRILEKHLFGQQD